MKTFYFDCFAGASGDMILGALAALGVDQTELLRQLALLGFSDYQIRFETVDRSGLAATHAVVEIPDEHAHRNLSGIIEIINKSKLSEGVKKRAVAIFTRLGEAEAKMHNVALDRVHFHEVGAMDAILDVVGAAIGFELLGVEKFICSRLHVGSGFVKMAHGKFPVPPPAVTELLKARNAPFYSTEITGELLTPTGAAIITTVCDEYGAQPEMNVEAVGYGAGTREYADFPNVLRLMLGETAEVQSPKSKVQSPKSKVQSLRAKAGDFVASKIETLLLIETNIDDLSPQVLGYVMERAFEMGALDCWFTPIQMKKNRQAILISILCEQADKQKFTDLLFAETTTLGVRVTETERRSLERDIIEVETEFGKIAVKIARNNGETIKASAEYDQCREIARQRKVPLRTVEAAAMRAFERIGQNE